MRLLLWTLIFLPAQVSAAPCSPKIIGPCTPGDTPKKAIMAAVEAGIAAQKAMSAEIDAVKTAEEENNLDAEMEALKNELHFRREMQSNFDRAIHLTERDYHLKPVAPNSHVAEPQGPGPNYGKDWATGMPASWAPKFFDGTKIYMEVRGMDGLDHHIGQVLVPGRDAANTFANGKVVISPTVLKATVESGNPGFLAFYIHHEARHFTELTTTGWDTREQGEERAYADGLAAADIFEIDRVRTNGHDMDFRTWLAGLVQEERNLVRNAKSSLDLTPMFPRPDEEKLNSSEFAHFETEEKKLLTQIATIKKTLADAKSASDAELKLALRDIAVKACADPESITMNDVQNLPPVFDSNFDRSLPGGLSTNCSRSLFLFMANDIAHGERISSSFVKKYANNFLHPPTPEPLPLFSLS